MNTQQSIAQSNNSQQVPVSIIVESLLEISRDLTEPEQKHDFHLVVTTLANNIRRELGSFDAQVFMSECGVNEQWRKKVA